MSKAKEAYVCWTAGVCSVLTYPEQKPVSRSRHFRRATRRARNLGFDVRVYCACAKLAPRDAVNVSDSSYVLPRKP